MAADSRPTAFLGRSAEREALDRLLESARQSRSGTLVIRGVAGVGKTALLRLVASQASGFHTVQVTGVESEMELPFAGLHQLCMPLLGGLDSLAEPQRRALCVAFGLASGATPDRLLVGLATLSLMAAAAESQSLLCVVDDLQWLDAASAQVLGFVARRILAEPMAIVFAVREPSDGRHLAGLTELRLGGLDYDDARALLMSAVAGPMDPRVGERIIAEARGNPLALLELPRSMSAAELAGGFDRPAPATHEEGFLRRLEQLPSATRRLLHWPRPIRWATRCCSGAPLGDSASSRRRRRWPSTPACLRSGRRCGSGIRRRAPRSIARHHRGNGKCCTVR